MLNGEFTIYKIKQKIENNFSVFLSASFGSIHPAIKKLEKVIGYSNSLGIFSEDIDPTTKGQLGNFGQTYGHVGLINAVFRIAKKVDGNIFD